MLGLQGLDGGSTQPPPVYTKEIDEICTWGMIQLNDSILDYSDLVWGVIASLEDITEREKKVNQYTDTLMQKTEQIVNKITEDTKSIIRSLHSSEHQPATEYWKQTTERLRVFHASSMYNWTKNAMHSLDMARRILEDLEKTKRVIKADLDKGMLGIYSV